MKNILSTFICLGLLLFSGLWSQPIYQGYSSNICIRYDQDFQDDMYVYIDYKMKQIHQTLINYEFDGSTYKIGFDYHMGYLNGQYEAYRNLNEKFNQP